MKSYLLALLLGIAGIWGVVLYEGGASLYVAARDYVRPPIGYARSYLDVQKAATHPVAGGDITQAAEAPSHWTTDGGSDAK